MARAVSEGSAEALACIGGRLVRLRVVKGVKRSQGGSGFKPSKVMVYHKHDGMIHGFSTREGSSSHKHVAQGIID